MNTLLLLLFVLPLSAIIFSIALEKILRNPILVAAIIFAASLIIAFVAFAGTATAIIAAILYGLLALVVAFITELVDRYFRRNCNNNCSDDNNDNDDDNNDCPNTRACRICRCQRNLLR